MLNAHFAWFNAKGGIVGSWENYARGVFLPDATNAINCITNLGK